MTEVSHIVKIVSIGKDQYSISENKETKGLVLYRKMGSSSKPYEVGFNAQGMVACTCTGFRYHDKCKHTTNFEEIMDSLPEAVATRPEIVVEPGRIAYTEIESVVDQVAEFIRTHGFRVDPAGSFRRGQSTVKDLDFVTNASCEVLVSLFELDDAPKIVTGTQVVRFDITYGAEEKVVQVDFCIMDHEAWGAALMYLTGSKEFNIFMRARAKSLGLKLSRHGLAHRNGIDGVIASKTESDIFRALNMEFVPPSLRANDNWVEFIGS